MARDAAAAAGEAGLKAAAAQASVKAAAAQAGLATRCAGLAMAAVLAFGPWEFRDGLALRGLNVSLPELLAALAAALGGVAVLLHAGDPHFRAHARRVRPVLLALGAWAILHLASALWAPVDHGLAADRGLILKFGLRVSGMMVLAGLACLLSFSRTFQGLMLGGLLLGLALLSALGVAERLLGRELEGWLRLFRDEPTWMLGEQRLSLLFYHANTAAAYLELAAPALLVLTALAWPRRWLRLPLLAWLALTAILLSLTYSRAGLGAGVLGALLLAVAGPRLPRWTPLRALALLFAVTVVAAYVANPDMRARIGLTDRSYRARYTFAEPCLGHPGQRVPLPLAVKNLGEWPLANVQAPGTVMYTLLTPAGKRMQGWWETVKLPDLPSGETAHVVLHPRLPARPGKYVLAVDILRDEILRISALGNPLAWLRCTVLRPDEDEAALRHQGVALGRPSDTSAVTETRRLDLQRRHYWRAALLLFARRPLLGYGADRFRLVDRGWVPDEAWDPRARAHSVAAETAVDFGLLGLAVLLALVVVAARRLWRILRQAELAAHAPALAAMAALGGLAVHSQVDYFLAYTQVAVLIWPLLGLACGAPLAPAIPPAVLSAAPPAPEESTAHEPSAAADAQR